ncbi:biopolymer transporter ExbD [Novipirellula artificiosorum]|uniref:Biopolymer transport protein ExbD/TolR n=1 Tax=Novipirellula artificiosorum TaxID=2528016 RepID=A0A5C6DBG0_9BACT|nr:biopolymer transporter ExbD [Novipirellula artificiosorum]TWU34513.1 Biopolymer transport protein ExbD/TolR [Novipirellula artificiosorum]
MAIQVECLQCGSVHNVNDRLAGRRVRCPHCDTAVHVPEADQAVLAAIPSETEDFDEIVDAIEEEPVSAVPVESVSIPVFATGSTPVLADDEDSDQVPRRKPRETEDLDMTPMVDVTFLLLIFFMVTASFSLQKSIEMPRQQTDQASVTPKEDIDDPLDSVEVQVDERGSFLVLAVDWERETPGKQNLTLALREAMTAVNEGMTLNIKVHELAKLRYLVDAMDAGTIAGFTELKVMQVEEFD